MTRYAIYYTPPPDSALGRLGRRWFDGVGADIPPDVHARLTAAPRRYGFHATLKAPFSLAAGIRNEDLSAEIARFANERTPLFCGRLILSRLDGFVALMLAESSPPLDALAADCVRRFDRFRAPLPPAEFERRAAGLPEDARSNLAEYGYPWVLDRFRFHLTLTDRVTEQEWTTHKPLLDEMCREALGAPLVVDALSLMREPAPAGGFELLERFALAGVVAPGP